MACSAFPFLTPSEFEGACQAIADRCTSAQDGWSIRLLTKPGIGFRVTKYISGPETPDPRSQEDDPEALVRTQPSLQVDYDILLSSTYQVPVLYFGLRSHNHGPLGLDEVYQYVVPEQYKQELKSVGVMGGISMGYHPDSGAPAFFVHPCNTADAMAHLADAENVTPGSYLLIWLGLVGHCVNLHVPREYFV
ncbi:Autophagy-related protein 3 [Penicillium brevicompactum]|uniref:Autophagy-related protein 3 n=1 Tax=Penicillium brevicompactum TaxID=5074 RepID=UPI002541AFAB|nr:Autophagy-related protein 3 [Penicillium brevicompactum]KAJ5347725.1 Autophagy-related protein 3 [Penicillium brevicompactum]